MAYLKRFRHEWALGGLLIVAVIVLLTLSCASRDSAPASGEVSAGQEVTLPAVAEPPRYVSSADIQTLTLDQVFYKQALPANLDSARTRTLVATGDIIPARMTNWQMVQRNDFKYPFEPTVDLLRRADLTFVNLEAPLVKGCQPTMQGMTFCGDQRFVEGLTYAGVDIANLANNHSDNYGSAGVSQTIDVLSQNEIDTVGVGNAVVKDVNDLRFGFLGYNGVGGYFDREAMVSAVRSLRPKVDVLIVTAHWGKEYVSVPEAAPGVAEDDPRAIGRLLIDAGADLIIGNHPHWVQGLEIYKGKLITYAHGNFIFDQMWSQETREGVVGKYTFYDTKLMSVEFTPVIIEDYAQPRIAPEAEAKAILDRMEAASRQMAR
ncbi:MAG: CapA family protein [Chloroflexi bacterium]|nr:CapA family protein [Chloroflexota bacterium]